MTKTKHQIWVFLFYFIERWLPKSQRSDYKPLNKKEELKRGPQGSNAITKQIGNLKIKENRFYFY